MNPCKTTVPPAVDVVSRQSSRRALLVGSVRVTTGAALAVILAGRSQTAGAAKSAKTATTPEVAGVPAAADEPEAALQRVVDTQVAASPSIPGLIVYVGQPSIGLDWSGAAGTADRATGEPLTPDATFRIASNTKTFTAAAALRLVEEGSLDLDAPIAEYLLAEYLEALTTGGYDPTTITVRHLLNHASGIYDYAEDQGFVDAVVSQPHKRWTRLEQVRFAMDHGRPYAQPGAEFHYSDTGYVLLGEIVERATGQPLATAYREFLGFARLGLDATYLESLEPVPPTAGPRAHQYFGELDTFAWDPSFDLYGGGGLVSSVADLARFYRALFTGGVFRAPETLQTMLAIPPSNAGSEAGMGLFNHDVGDRRCWNHDGFWGTTAVHCPDDDLTIVLAVDQAQTGADFDAARLVADLLAAIGAEA